MPCTRAWGHALGHGCVAPGQILHRHLAAFAGILGRQRQQAFRGIGTPVEDHVLDAVQQVLGDVLVQRQLSGVDDTHVHARLDGVIQKDRMDRLAHGVVAAEGERHIGYAAGNQRVGQGALDFARRLDEVHGVVVVLLDTGGDGEDIRIENNILRREADLLREYLVGAGTDVHLAPVGVRLAGFIEGHDDDRGAVTAHQARLADEFFLALFQADGVHHRLALHALESRLQHRPLGRVDHHRHA